MSVPGSYPNGIFPVVRVVGGAADLYYSESVGQSGAEWTDPVAVALDVDPYCFGLAHVGARYLAVYSRSMVPYVKITENPDDWTTGVTETPLSDLGGPARGIVRGASTDGFGNVAVLILDLQTHPYTQISYWHSYAWVTRNQGETWELRADFLTSVEETIVASGNHTFTIAGLGFISEVSL
jgi:hypothetical protein